MKQDSFKSMIAVLTALVTVLGATAACLAAGATSDAGDADFAGLDASIRAQKAEIINYVYAYEHYRAFTSYVRYNELGNLMYNPNANEEESIQIGRIQREVWGLASGISSSFFSPRYITPEGKYDLEREIQEAFAEDAQSTDLNSLPYFRDSDKYREKSSFLTATMILFAFSFWFFTFAQATDKKIKYFWAGTGILIGLAGVICIFIGSAII